MSFRFRQLKFHLDEGHLDPATTILALAPAFDLEAGPVEELWHVTSRANASVTHYLLQAGLHNLKHPENKKLMCYDDSHSLKLLKNHKVKVMPIKFKDVYDYNKLKETAKDRMNVPEDIMHRKAWNILEEFFNK